VLKEDHFTLHSEEPGSINANQGVSVPPGSHDEVFTWFVVKNSEITGA
jgi:hypothetical protein